MATSEGDPVAPVLAALASMRGNVDRTQKSQAHEYLEKFQKSPEAWTTTHTILASLDIPTEVKLFAVTTLKGKITYDLDQIPRESLPALRDSILSQLKTFQDGPRPIRTQLCVCLANLAIQMLDWKDVLQHVGSTLGSSAGDCILEFLRVLPEEVTEGRRINLTEEELDERTKELLEENAGQVLGLLTQYAQSSASAASNPHLLECISSWLREIPSANVVNSPLLDTIINALSNDKSFEAAVDCMCNLYKDTREVDESIEIIQRLYPRIIALRPKIAQAAETEDSDTFKGITRLFAEAGEAWVVLIARLPAEFRSLVEAILECCARDGDREAVSLTFIFWYEFKQMITLEKYIPARQEYTDVFASLVDVMVKHLEFPTPEDGNESDLFGGDREQEEKFREFRHQMGDVLKDCCEVITVGQCLGKSFLLIKSWIAKYGPQVTGDKIPHWQELEAPLFGLRAMGRMVSPEENEVLPQIIPLMVQIPNHEKLQFQAIMALGRYTEWTAQHPEYLQPQLNFTIAGFNHESKEVVRAAALAFKFFGTDCKKLLQNNVTQLHAFYESVIDKLPSGSQEEVTEGAAYVVSAQPLDKVHASLKLYCDPLIKRLMSLANEAMKNNERRAKLDVADYLGLITIFIQTVQPYVSPTEENPAVTYCQEILPVLSAVAENFTNFTPILESVCKCWRYMVLSYRTAVLPLLPNLAQQLATGFQNSRQGCFLWATDSVLREFATGAEFIDEATSQAIYEFFEQQAIAFLRILNDLPPEDLPDVIQDSFRLFDDALIYYNHQLIPAPISEPILNAAISSLSLQQEEPLSPTLHYLQDFISYGTDHPNSSNFDDEPPSTRAPNPIEIQTTVKRHISTHGENLVLTIMTGLMWRFPRECFPDASGVLLGLFELLPQQTAVWVEQTISKLPQGTVKAGEAERLMGAIRLKVHQRDLRKVRVLLQDFTNSYRRRNVAPREGLGRIEATRFRFNG